MKPWGNAALTGSSCENSPSRTTGSHILLRKEELRANISPEIPQDLGLWRRPACQILPKTLNISSATAQVASYLLKALTILSDTNITRSAAAQKDLKPNWKSEKRPHLPRWSTILLCMSFSKTLLTTERRQGSSF